MEKGMKFTLTPFVGALIMTTAAHGAPNPRASIPGYTYGQSGLAHAPYSLKDLESLKKTMLFTDEDIRYLRMSKPILENQTEAILDVWYGFVASTPSPTSKKGSSNPTAGVLRSDLSRR